MTDFDKQFKNEHSYTIEIGLNKKWEKILCKNVINFKSYIHNVL